MRAKPNTIRSPSSTKSEAAAMIMNRGAALIVYLFPDSLYGRGCGYFRSGSNSRFYGSMGRGIDGSRDRWVDGSMGRWIDGSMRRWIDGSRDRWVDGSMDRWVDGSMDRWVDGSMPRVERTAPLCDNFWCGAGRGIGRILLSGGGHFGQEKWTTEPSR